VTCGRWIADAPSSRVLAQSGRGEARAQGKGRGGEVAATARRSWPRSSAYVVRSATSRCSEPRHDAGAMGHEHGVGVAVRLGGARRRRGPGRGARRGRGAPAGASRSWPLPRLVKTRSSRTSWAPGDRGEDEDAVVGDSAGARWRSAAGGGLASRRLGVAAARRRSRGVEVAGRGRGRRGDGGGSTERTRASCCSGEGERQSWRRLGGRRGEWRLGLLYAPG
jgi:hypothetical protein